MRDLITVSSLTKKYKEVHAVNDVTFTLQEGTATALIGPNGSGKTTTLSMLSGLLQPTDGEVFWQGNKVEDIREHIGFLPQYPAFYEWMSAMEYVTMMAKLHRVPTDILKKRVEEVLYQVGLENAKEKRIGTYSGGMKQRLGIAQAIVHKPKLLLLDEPVSALDPTGRREVMHLLKALQSEMTILYSTHILNDAEEMTDQLLFLSQGKIIEKGSLLEVKQKYTSRAIKVDFQTSEHMEIFQQDMHIENEQIHGNRSIIIDTNMNLLFEKLAKYSFEVDAVQRYEPSLEDIFMKVVQGE